MPLASHLGRIPCSATLPESLQTARSFLGNSLVGMSPEPINTLSMYISSTRHQLWLAPTCVWVTSWSLV
ncbi:hypothetical protein E2562_004119 [Oryza meyeriana var. granulata]|uniref:Uncharacterized protein n=1 Tax=Oryza meyeriana var. granulata TaxID=110450 RepID=A0A6G1EV15_9ORYZ|nr:hypothetical protein E2562_004119 [Oryza meyeriana var. granulata]